MLESMINFIHDDFNKSHCEVLSHRSDLLGRNLHTKVNRNCNVNPRKSVAF